MQIGSNNDGIAWFSPKAYSSSVLAGSKSHTSTPVLWVQLQSKGMAYWCRPLPSAQGRPFDVVASPKYQMAIDSDGTEFTVVQRYYRYEVLKQVSVTLMEDQPISKALMSDLRIALLGSIAVSEVVVRLYIQRGLVKVCLSHSQTITSPEAIPIISGETEILFSTPTTRRSNNPRSQVQPITDPKNPLDFAFNRLFETVCFPVIHRQAIQKLGLDLPRGVLITGPSGVGKTSLVGRIAKASQLPLLTIRGPELVGQNLGESEGNLSESFRRAREMAAEVPHGICILFIDEIDSIALKRGAPQQSASSIRLVSQLLILMDGIDQKGKDLPVVIVMGATNRSNAIDPALRRPGRFDREITIDPPNASERLDMLQGMLGEMTSVTCTANLVDISRNTAGFVAADLTALLREAFFASQKEKGDSHCVSGDGVDDSSADGHLTDAHFATALKIVRPSLSREYSIAVEPNITFASIGGYGEVKERLRQSLEWPLLHAASFRRLGLTAPRGILLHGPPGCSKTTFAKAIANMASLNFYSLSGASVLSAYYGESERTIRTIFQNARLTKPSVVFVDELDALVGKRTTDGQQQQGSGGGSEVSTRILTTFLNEMDGIEGCDGVFVLAATNRLHAIDPALLRPGRFDQLIEVGLPDAASRREILAVRLASTPLDANVSLDMLVERTADYSGAMLCKLVQEAALTAISHQSDRVGMADFMAHIDR